MSQKWSKERIEDRIIMAENGIKSKKALRKIQKRARRAKREHPPTPLHKGELDSTSTKKGN